MSLLDRSASIGFCLNPLDRVSGRREDPAFIEAQWRDPQTRFLAFSGDVPVLSRTGATYDALFSKDELAAFGTVRQAVFLGLQEEGKSLFGCAFEPGLAEKLTGDTDREAVDLRSIALRGLVTPAILGILSQAKEVLDWHHRHGFCANCGKATEVAAGGWRRDCLSCNTMHFPRVDPVVIMLVVHEGRCLLGRQERFPEKMYSALAGFLEQGETVEDAVRREVLEEAGISCSHVRYFASQPWPFPSSLMIGCFARASSSAITIDVKELEEARWFTREDVSRMMAETHPGGLNAPKPLAIAHHLLLEFLTKGDDVVAA